jgi:hypothetical protein
MDNYRQLGSSYLAGFLGWATCWRSNRKMKRRDCVGCGSRQGSLV